MNEQNDIQARVEVKADEHWNWIKRNQNRLMIGAIVVLSLQNRSLRKDNLRLISQLNEIGRRNASLVIENDVVRDMNKVLVGIMKGDAVKYPISLMEQYFGNKQ